MTASSSGGRGSAETPNRVEDDIAVVGCGLRLPGDLGSLEDLWQFLIAGGDAISDLPPGRWQNDLYDPSPRRGWTYVRRAGYVGNLDLIDISFLNCSPKEASHIDPQQRLLIETAFEALENAGMTLERIARTRTGVFVGISSTDYIQMQNDDIRSGNAYSNTGGALSIAANRISYTFDLRGPSVAIDTACSSGLTAFDFAVRSIKSGTCEMAIVGAANALFKPEVFAGFCAAGMLSPDGQCRAFDADGNGFVRAEGALAFVLEPLGRALRANDPILCVVRGSDTNNDGRTSGLSLPNAEAQFDLIDRVLRDHRIRPDDVVYVEAHGTGTAVGDPIEASAIGRAIARRRRGDARLPIGSIKTNIGHLEPAAGLAGVAKAILCLQRGAVPPSLHFDTPNPAIDFADLRIEVVTETTPLPETAAPALIAINSFGFGGANAHAVVGQAPAPPEPVERPIERPWFMVSGRSAAAMHAAASELSRHLADRPDQPSLHELSGNLLTRRSWHPHRTAIWADSIDQLRRALDAAADDRDAANLVGGTALPAARPAFVFTGNGPQWWGMGRELYDHSATFRAAVDQIDGEFRAISEVRLVDEMRRSEADSRMARTEIAQPALFALQVGLVRCLAEDGLLPGATIGHSAGELAAAYCAGAFDLTSIVRVVSARSHEQGKTAGQGAMAVIGCGADRAGEIIGNDLVVAGDNSPDATTVAGPIDAIDALVARLEQAGTFARKLQLDYAFHSSAMDPIERDFRDRVRGTIGRVGDLPFYSTVTGGLVEGPAIDEDYWWRNLRDPVAFRPAIESMLADGFAIFVEIGPHPNLIAHVRAVGAAAGRNVRTIATLRRGDGEVDARRRTIAAAAVAGSVLDLSARFPEPVRVLGLPTYPWQRERHFVSPDARASVASKPSGHPLLGRRLALASDVWHHDIALSRLPFVADHVIRDSVLFPAAAFLEVALAAAHADGVEGRLELRDVQIDRALALDDAREVTLQTFIDRTDHSLSVCSRPVATDPDVDAAPFVEHVRAVVEHRPASERSIDLDAIRARIDRARRAPGEHYALAAARGLNYGPAFQTVDGIHLGEREVLATLSRRADVGLACHLDPTQIDGALQAMIGLIGDSSDRRLFVPVGLDRLIYHRSTRDHPTVHAHVTASHGNRFYLSANIVVTAADGEVLAELHGVQVRAVGDARTTGATHLRHVWHALDRALPWIDLERSSDTGIMRSVRHALGRARPELEDHLAETCAAFTTAAFRELAGGVPFAIAGLAERGGIAGPRIPYARAILRHAVEAGMIGADPDGGHWFVAAPDPVRLWRDRSKLHPEHLADWMAVWRIGTRLTQILGGTIDPAEVLSPAGAGVFAEQVEQAGVGFAAANALVAAAMELLVEAATEDRFLRVLEIGGGTGGTTACLLEVLPPARTEYVFTDPSEEALRAAERRFKDVGFLSTAQLDPTTEVDTTPLGPRFDVIIAKGLDRSADPRAALRRTAGLLVEGGYLALLLPSSSPIFVFVLGGQSGGVPSSAGGDSHDRTSLLRQDWQVALAEEGLVALGYSDDADPDGTMPAPVVLARRPASDRWLGDSRANGSDDETALEARRWMVLAPAADSDLASGLIERLRSARQEVVVIEVTPAGSAIGDGADLRIPPDDDHALTAWFARPEVAEPDEIVVVAPDATADQPPGNDDGWLLVNLVRAASAAGWCPRLSIVTQGLADGEAYNMAAAPYWGIGRTIVNEQPGWRCRRIDCERSVEARMRLVSWLVGDSRVAPTIADDVDEIRVASGAILASRLEVLAGDRPATGANGRCARPFALTLRAQGSIDNLVLRETPPVGDLPEGFVEVSMKAAGLNFKDVLLTLGLLPPEILEDGDVGPLMGLEGAGRVTRVGRGVTTLGPGDGVMLMAEGCLASSVIAPAPMVRRMPEGWSFGEAATLPVVGLTVVYALASLARLRAHETLLVHGGAGGIGLMAIQYARAIGARVIATAGTEAKRDLLTALGVDCVSDSRTLRFDEDVRAFTDGRGVDVVLNSIAGDAMLASLDLVKPFGRFVEIGKRDLEANNRLNLKALKHNVSYFAVDLTDLPRQRPDLMMEVWEQLIDACERKVVRPLPFRIYRLERIGEAFRQMQSGRHVGKLVVALNRGARLPVEPGPSPRISLAADGVHLITGGLGGIGLRMARWMSERGARRIALIGRRGLEDDQQRAAIAAIEAQGATVTVARLDVSDAERLEAFLCDLTSELGPIRGIVHAVLALDDRMMINMTRDSFMEVTRAKVQGAFHLHRLTRDQPLDYFVALSSIAATIGNPGQASYVAANAYLDQLMAARVAEGRPGLSLALGPVGDAGVVGRNQKLKGRLDDALGATITVDDVLAALDRLLPRQRSEIVVANGAARLALPIAQTRRLALLSGGAGDALGEGAEAFDLAAIPPEERLAAIEAVLVESVAKVSGAKAERIDPERALSELGLDSLMLVELGMHVEKRLGTSLQGAEVTQDVSVRGLATSMLERLRLDGTEAAGQPVGPRAARPATTDPAVDTVLPEGLVFPGTWSPRPLGECQAVLLTGATGFLGAFLLDQLLARNTPRVICLVRGRDHDHARARLAEVLHGAGLDDASAEIGRRVEVWPADLAKDDLGLSERRHAELAETVDVILHDAADVSFVKGYEEMRATNVLSVRRLLGLAAQGSPKAFQLVSTLRVYSRLEQVRDEEISEAVVPLPPAPDESGYVKSKWVADMLAHAARERGFPVGIYRPSFVVGRTTDGYSRVSDLGSALAKFAFDTGVLPDVEGPLPIIPVDVAARRIVTFVDSPGEQFETRHITDWPALHMRDLEAAGNQNGHPVALLPLDQFVERADAFFESNPRHPAVWLPRFFASDVAQNTLGSRLTRPVLPAGEVDPQDRGRESLARMVGWFRRLESQAAEDAFVRPADLARPAARD